MKFIIGLLKVVALLSVIAASATYLLTVYAPDVVETIIETIR